MRPLRFFASADFFWAEVACLHRCFSAHRAAAYGRVQSSARRMNEGLVHPTYQPLEKLTLRRLEMTQTGRSSQQQVRVRTCPSMTPQYHRLYSSVWYPAQVPLHAPLCMQWNFAMKGPPYKLVFGDLNIAVRRQWNQLFDYGGCTIGIALDYRLYRHGCGIFSGI